MNLGQTMLTAGMLLLLIMSVISANRMISENAEAQFQTEALVTAASLANDLLLEIMSKQFDGTVDPATLALGTVPATSFSPYLGTGWGPHSTESANWSLPDSSDTGAFKSITAYNDIDDYDGYSRTAKVTGGIWGNGVRFHLRVVVYYVSAATPDTKNTISNTFFKRIAVTVQQDQYLNANTGNLAVYTALASY